MLEAVPQLTRELGDAMGLAGNAAFLRDGLVNIEGRNVVLRWEARFGVLELSAAIDLGPLAGPFEPSALRLLLVNDLVGRNARLVFAIDPDCGHVILTSRTHVDVAAFATQAVRNWLRASVRAALALMARLDSEADVRDLCILLDVPPIAVSGNTTAQQWRDTLDVLARGVRDETAAGAALGAYEDPDRGLLVRHCEDRNGVELVLKLGTPRDPSEGSSLMDCLLRLNHGIGRNGFVTFGVLTGSGDAYIRILKAYVPYEHEAALQEGIAAACALRDSVLAH